MTKINFELREKAESPTGYEVWASLDDILDWLKELPGKTGSPAVAGAASEIREMLIEAVTSAEPVSG